MYVGVKAMRCLAQIDCKPSGRMRSLCSARSLVRDSGIRQQVRSVDDKEFPWVVRETFLYGEA